MSYENKHVLRDGRITLYTRNDRATYHVRLKVEGHKGYIVKSTRRRTLAEAVRVAEDLYDDLRYKVRQGLEIRAHTFQSMWKRWEEANQNILSDHRMRFIRGTANRYFIPYFGDKAIEELSHVAVEGYWSWRINYWTSDEGRTKIAAAQNTKVTRKRPYRQKLGNVAKIPAPKTLQMEQSALRQIFSWAQRNGIIQHVPEIVVPKSARSTSISRRPAFELQDWRTLYRYLREWVEEGADGKMTPESRGKKRPHSLHIWQRRMIRNYILFMGCSGLRPNEARQLRWGDISLFVDQNKTEHVVLHISPDTKTKERECIPLQSARRYLDDIRSISDHLEPGDLIFCDREGESVMNYGKTFKKILKDTNLLEDRFGRVRTIYSLRHTYATFKLLYGKTAMEDLAQNMGTSPTQIYNHYRHITVRQKAADMGGQLHPELSRKGLYF